MSELSEHARLTADRALNAAFDMKHSTFDDRISIFKTMIEIKGERIEERYGDLYIEYPNRRKEINEACGDYVIQDRF